MATDRKDVFSAPLVASAICSGATIGFGLFVTLFVLVYAIKTSFFPDSSFMVKETIPTVLFILAIALLSIPFLIAGFIAARTSYQQHLLDALIHSFGSWALIGIFLTFFMSIASIGNQIQKEIKSFKPPQVITDVQVLKAKAITTVKSDKSIKKTTPEEQQQDRLLGLGWWLCFYVLLFGALATFYGGKRGYTSIKRHHQAE